MNAFHPSGDTPIDSKPRRRGPGKKRVVTPWVVLDHHSTEAPDLRVALARIDADLAGKLFSEAEDSYAAYKRAAQGEADLTSPHLRERLIAELTGSHPLNSIRWSYLADALIALVRAERAAVDGMDNYAWHYVSEARYRIGMAEGDYIALERKDQQRISGRKGAEKRAEKLAGRREPVVYKCSELLRSVRPLEGWASPQAAAERITQELADFIAENKIRGFSDYPFEYIIHLIKDHPLVQKAFEEKD
jgi:hypothetical protein